MSEHAYPSPGVVLPSGHQQGAYEGMTLRDHFAGLAMQGIVASMVNGEEFCMRKGPQWAYEVADAMIRERAK
jgi:hypothetical protein